MLDQWLAGMSGFGGLGNLWAGYASQPGITAQLQAMAQRTPYDRLYTKVRVLEAENAKLQVRIEELEGELVKLAEPTHLQQYTGGPNG